MSKEMMDMLTRMGSDENDATIMPLIHDMMSNLLSKDVLYPSLKDISLKVFLICFNLLRPAVLEIKYINNPTGHTISQCVCFLTSLSFQEAQ